MINLLKIFLLISALFILFTGAWPGVTVLPYGSEHVVQLMSNVVNKFIEVNPFFSTLWLYLKLVLYIEFLLFSWTWTKWLIEHLR